MPETNGHNGTSAGNGGTGGNGSGAPGESKLAAVLADAAMDLPETVRVATPMMLPVAVFAVLLTGWVSWRRHSEKFLARVLERRDPSLGNRLSNAVDLEQKIGDSPVQELLRPELPL